MIFIPVPQQAPAPTANSRELGRRIDDVVRDFKRDHPNVTDSEVRSALLHSAPTAGANPTNARRAIAVLVGIMAAFTAGSMVLGDGSTRPGSGVWMYVGVAIGIVGLVFAGIQFARRD